MFFFFLKMGQSLKATQHLFFLALFEIKTKILILFLFLLQGLAWKHCKEIMHDGLIKYLSDGRNLIDTIILILYTSAFMTEVSGKHQVSVCRQTGQEGGRVCVCV